MLGVAGAHGHGLGDLLVDDDIDLDALLGLALQDAVEAPLLVVCRWATEVQLRCKPPVLRGASGAGCMRARGSLTRMKMHSRALSSISERAYM